MRILVIGGTQFIGPVVVGNLLAAGHEVTVFHRGETEAATLPMVPHLHGDRHRLADYASEFARIAPEVVLDMVAYIERDALAVMETFTGIARRVVALSSLDVYRAFGRLHGIEPGPPTPCR